MNESGHVGVIGALLPKTSGNPASGVREVERGVKDDGAEGSGQFAEIFDDAGAGKKRGDGDARETGVVIESAHRAERPSNDRTAFDAAVFRASGEGLGALSVEFQRQAAGRSENISSIQAFRPLNGDVNQLARNVDSLSKFAGVVAPDRGAALSQSADTALTTIKLGPPTADGREATHFDVRRDGALTLSLRPDAATGVDVRVVDARAGLSPTQRLHPELEAGRDRVIEIRPTLAEAATAPAQGNQNILAAAAMPTSFINAYGFPASPFISGQAGPVAVREVDALFDPALSVQAASTRGSGGAALVASSSAQSFVAMAGVLPQIQAAIVARNGRDVVEVRLDPPDLGRVRIGFNVENGETIRAVVGAERPETLDHLKRNIVDLEQHLKQAGFASISFEFSSDQQRFADGENAARELAAELETDAGAAAIQNTIYLSLRENAQLDLLL